MVKRATRKDKSKGPKKKTAASRAAVKAADQEERQESRGDQFVVLLRHGIAEPRGGSKPDLERTLTKGGHARMKQIARGLAQVFPKAEAIYSSPALRCIQTALWVSKGYRGKLSPQTTDVLAHNGSPRELREFLGSLQERRVILVGHEPNLSTSLSELTRLNGPSSLELKKGGCYGVRLGQDGSSSLEWVLPPRLLRRLGA